MLLLSLSAKVRSLAIRSSRGFGLCFGFDPPLSSRWFPSGGGRVACAAVRTFPLSSRPCLSSDAMNVHASIIFNRGFSPFGQFRGMSFLFARCIVGYIDENSKWIVCAGPHISLVPSFFSTVRVYDGAVVPTLTFVLTLMRSPFFTLTGCWRMRMGFGQFEVVGSLSVRDVNAGPSGCALLVIVFLLRLVANSPPKFTVMYPTMEFSMPSRSTIISVWWVCTSMSSLSSALLKSYCSRAWCWLASCMLPMGMLWARII